MTILTISHGLWEEALLSGALCNGEAGELELVRSLDQPFPVSPQVQQNRFHVQALDAFLGDLKRSLGIHLDTGREWMFENRLPLRGTSYLKPAKAAAGKTLSTLVRLTTLRVSVTQGTHAKSNLLRLEGVNRRATISPVLNKRRWEISHSILR